MCSPKAHGPHHHQSSIAKSLQQQHISRAFPPNVRPKFNDLQDAPPTGQGGGEKEGMRMFRSLRRIKEGEEVTNDYLSEHSQLSPVETRQQKLSATKSFVCGCERCV